MSRVTTDAGFFLLASRALPHRHQDFTELCFDCKVPTSSSCLRCGRPLCEEHGPRADDQRCKRCEFDYGKKTGMLKRAARGELSSNFGRIFVGIIGAIFLPGTLAACVVAGPALGSGLAASVLLGYAWWYRRTPPRKLAAQRMLRKARKKFMRKRARKALPPAPDDA